MTQLPITLTSHHPLPVCDNVMFLSVCVPSLVTVAVAAFFSFEATHGWPQIMDLNRSGSGDNDAWMMMMMMMADAHLPHGPVLQ